MDWQSLPLGRYFEIGSHPFPSPEIEKRLLNAYIIGEAWACPDSEKWWEMEAQWMEPERGETGRK